MNFNIVDYLSYFLATAFIILRVGGQLYRNGGVYLNFLYPNQVEMVSSLNRLLLLGYYLLNLGYVAYSIYDWPIISEVVQLIVVLSSKIGFICVLLGAIHFANMIWVRLLKKFNSKL